MEGKVDGVDAHWMCYSHKILCLHDYVVFRRQSSQEDFPSEHGSHPLSLHPPKPAPNMYHRKVSCILLFVS